MALTQFTEKDFMRLPPITFLLIMVTLFLLFRNLRGVLIPAGSVLIALIWTFGLMAWTGNAPFPSHHDRPHFSHCRGYGLLHVYFSGIRVGPEKR
jgi:hypothetical protein